jgi:putative hydrolase of the HAD superfamily
MLRAVVFDLFHTLTGLESEWSTVPFTSDFLGVDRRLWDSALHSQSRWRLIGEEKDTFRILRRLIDTVDARIPDDRVHAAVKVREQRFREALSRIPPENVETLKRLKERGLRLGLISNADASEVASWQGCPLCDLFDAAVFSCDAGCVKPDFEIFEACLDQLGVSAGESLYVGDGGSDELVGAKAAGFKTVFISGIIQELWPDRVAERLAIADHHIERLPEVEAVVGMYA